MVLLGLAHMATALLVGCASVPSQVTVETRGGVLAGTWEGSIVATTTDEKGAPISFPVSIKLTIDGQDAHIYVRNGNGGIWLDQGQSDRFVLDARGTNAVIYSNRAGRIRTPDGSRWFETYLVAVTVKNADQLLVQWLRMVNNVDTSVDDPDHAGISAGQGVLDRK